MPRNKAWHGTAAVLAAASLLLVGACSGPDDALGPDPRHEAAETNDTSTRQDLDAQGELLSRLRDGGLTIVIRHAATDQSDPDDAEVDLDDCSTQRNLSDQGRAEAAMIGDGVTRLGIPIGPVWASPYCRSQDTAELAFGRAEVVDGLERLYPVRDEQADRRLNALIREQAPDQGEPNLAIVSHGVYPSVLEPAAPIAEGEAAVYIRQGDGFDLVGRLDPHEWAGPEPKTTPDTDELDSAPEGVADSVVSVQALGGTGTAFRVAVPGILVTSAQLVAGTNEVTVRQPDGREQVARVLGRHPDVDIAALRIDDDTALPPLHSGSGLADARRGDQVYAMGAGGLVTAGTIRDLNATVAVGGAELATIRLDRTTPSVGIGGPLVDEGGHVLGVLTTTPDQRDAAAVPVDIARDAALQLVRDSRS